jgi:hypothetical protein
MFVDPTWVSSGYGDLQYKVVCLDGMNVDGWIITFDGTPGVFVLSRTDNPSRAPIQPEHMTAGPFPTEGAALLAAEECKKRGYVAWAIFKGERFDQSRRLSGPNYIHHNEPVRNPAWLSAHGM